MTKRGLNNFRRKDAFHNGHPSWKLETLDGTPVPAFEVFCEKNSYYRYPTQKRYAEVVARFIDYLHEAKVLTEDVKVSHLNRVIEAYPMLLREGSEGIASRVRKSNDNLWLAEVAERLGWAPLAPKSFDNTLPAVNRFLRLSESLAREANEKASLLGINSIETYKPLINAVAGVRAD